MAVYKREGGDAAEAWNELIRRINELANECGVDELDEVGENHIIRKSDIQEAQDKLEELCDGNTFPDVPKLLKKETIDALIAAIEEGACCCEDWDETPYFQPGQMGGDAGSAIGDHPKNLAIDWLSGLCVDFAESRHTNQTTIEVPAPNPEDPPLSVQVGGVGWLGRLLPTNPSASDTERLQSEYEFIKRFDRWQVFMGLAGGSPTLISEGTCSGGYVTGFPGVSPGASLDSPFGYGSEITDFGDGNVGDPMTITVTERHTGATFDYERETDGTDNGPVDNTGFLHPAWPGSPYTLLAPTGNASFDWTRIVRLLCPEAGP